VKWNVPVKDITPQNNEEKINTYEYLKNYMSQIYTALMPITLVMIIIIIIIITRIIAYTVFEIIVICL